MTSSINQKKINTLKKACEKVQQAIKPNKISEMEFVDIVAQNNKKNKTVVACFVFEDYFDPNGVSIVLIDSFVNNQIHGTIPSKVLSSDNLHSLYGLFFSPASMLGIKNKVLSDDEFKALTEEGFIVRLTNIQLSPSEDKTILNMKANISVEISSKAIASLIFN